MWTIIITHVILDLAIGMLIHNRHWYLAWVYWTYIEAVICYIFITNEKYNENDKYEVLHIYIHRIHIKFSLCKDVVLDDTSKTKFMRLGERSNVG